MLFLKISSMAALRTIGALRFSGLQINPLTTDLNLNVLDQDVAQPVQPTEGLAGSDRHRGQLHAQVHAVDQVTVTGHGAGNLLVEVTGTIEGLLDGLHRKVRVTTINAAYPILSYGAGL